MSQQPALTPTDPSAPTLSAHNKKRKREQDPSAQFDWYEAGTQENIANYDIHQIFPRPWTQSAIDAAHGLSDGANDMHTRLWHVPDAPQQPSFLDFLTYCASIKLKQTELYGNSSRGGHFELQPCQRPRPNNNIEESDSTYQELMKELKHVGTILAKTWTWEESEKEKKSHKMDCKKLHHKFDETAAVALAVFAEESLISSLLPLARQHVSQCREIGHESPDQSGSNQSNLFVSRLTLSPSDAIRSIKDERSISGSSTKNLSIPSSRLPSLSTKSCKEMKQSTRIPTLAELVDKRSPKSHDEKERNEVNLSNRWCERHGFGPNFASRNSEIFQLFLSDAVTHSYKDYTSELDLIEKAITNEAQGYNNDNDGSFPKIINIRELCSNE